MTCPYCKDTVPEEDAVYCPACDSAHHEECWESNQSSCSVYGCESYAESDRVLGCPWCEEVFSSERRVCMFCNSPLLKPAEYRDFLDKYEWVELKLEEGANASLTAGYLRNHAVVARVKRRAPVSMFRIQEKASLWIADEHLETARRLIHELSEQHTYCPQCGHVLYIEEEDCSFCTETN